MKKGFCQWSNQSRPPLTDANLYSLLIYPIKFPHASYIRVLTSHNWKSRTNIDIRSIEVCTGLGQSVNTESDWVSNIAFSKVCITVNNNTIQNSYTLNTENNIYCITIGY